MTPARQTAQEEAALLRRHIDDGVPLTHLAEHAGRCGRSSAEITWRTHARLR